MTTPQPNPTPTGNSSGAQNKAAIAAAGLGALPPAGGGTSKFGLGTMSGSPVQVGALFPVLGKDGKIITPAPDGTYRAEDVMQAFASASSGDIAKIQQQLVLGGFYSSADYRPHYGVINAQDIDAFKKATEVAVQTGGNLSEYLARQAKYGEYQGVAAAMASAGAKPLQIQKADPLALGTLIERQFQQMTGRKPTDAEKAGFIAAYDAAFTQIQRDNYQAQADAATAATAGADPNFSAAPGLDAYGNSTVGAYDPKILGPDRADALNASIGQSVFYAQPQAPDPAAGPAEVVQEDFDPSAFAEDYVRRNATGETDAHDIASQFKTFMSLIGGITG